MDVGFSFPSKTVSVSFILRTICKVLFAQPGSFLMTREVWNGKISMRKGGYAVCNLSTPLVHPNPLNRNLKFNAFR